MSEQNPATFLDSIAGCQGGMVSLPVNFIENNYPGLAGKLKAQGFLVPDERPQYIDYFGETCALHYLDSPFGITNVCFYEEEGTFHRLCPEACLGSQVTYNPLAGVIHTCLQCRGNIEEIIPGFLWKAGVATRQSREVWLCRNPASFSERLRELPNSAILFYFGNCSSEPPLPHTFKFFNFVTEMNGKIILDSDSVIASLEEQIAVKSVRTGLKPAYGKQKNGRKAIESWLWMWFDHRLKAARIIAGDEEEEEVPREWAQYEVVSQKQICKSLGITPVVYTRTKTAWEKDKGGYGQFFLLINEEFVCRRPVKYTGSSSTAVDRLNTFFHAYRKVIEELRKHPPNIV